MPCGAEFGGEGIRQRRAGFSVRSPAQLEPKSRRTTLEAFLLLIAVASTSDLVDERALRVPGFDLHHFPRLDDLADTSPTAQVLPEKDERTDFVAMYCLYLLGVESYPLVLADEDYALLPAVSQDVRVWRMVTKLGYVGHVHNVLAELAHATRYAWRE